MKTLDNGENISYSMQRFLCHAEFVLWTRDEDKRTRAVAVRFKVVIRKKRVTGLRYLSRRENEKR